MFEFDLVILGVLLSRIVRVNSELTLLFEKVVRDNQLLLTFVEDDSVSF